MLAEAIAWFKKEGRVVKDAPILFSISVLFCAAILGIGIYWFVDHLYSAESRAKDATIVQKDARIGTISEERDAANRENEKLSKQVEGLRIYRAQDTTMSLKTKALILAKQIRDFTKDWKDTDPDQMGNVQKYLQRFGLRASIMRDDLDQCGQHSDDFDKVMFNFSYTYKDVQTIASQIEKLANNLPD